MAERHSSELRGVGDDDDPLRRFGGAAPINNRRLFITTTTVLPSCPTTPTVNGIFASIAKHTSTATVPSEITKF